MLNTNQIRIDFPILNNQQPPMVYFDNACMSLRPKSVIEAISYYYTHLSACGGRSNHRMAKAVTEAVEETRNKVCKFINAKKPAEIVFTRNTSEGLNLLAHSLPLKSKDEVVISDKEHNSNLVPWIRLVNTKNIKLIVVPSNTTNEADITAWNKSITPQTKIVSFVYTSNLDGVTNPVKDIIKLAKKVNAVTIVDAAQTAPHQPINVSDLDVDFLVFSIHKMCGPSGMGILYGKKNQLSSLSPFMVGGDTVAHTTYNSYTMLNSPEKFEAGLQDYAGIIGTGTAIDYLNHLGLQNIYNHEIALNQLLSEKMTKFSRIHLIGPQNPNLRGGIFAFTVDNANYHQVALMLDQMGKIMVRSGQHCVHSWFNQHQLEGSVRISLYFYNTEAEINHFINTLAKILQVI